MLKLKFLYTHPLVNVSGKTCQAEDYRSLFTEARKVLAASIKNVPILTADDKFRNGVRPETKVSWTDGQVMVELTKLLNDDLRKQHKEAGTLSKFKEIERPASYEAFFAMAEKIGMIVITDTNKK